MTISSCAKTVTGWKHNLYLRWRYAIASLIALATLLSATAVNATEWVQSENDGLFLYYPASEHRIAARLWDAFPAIQAFLLQHGLPVALPLHVVIDDDRDQPEVIVDMIPHREIRIPLRAPGVLEDGYLEADPWHYFFFKGLALQGIYNDRGGIPAAVHKVLGEVISPNLVIPQWITDGVCHLLYQRFMGDVASDPLDQALLRYTAPPDMDKLSNHPEVWPGHFNYRIYGRPFIAWVANQYDWPTLLDFIHRHGQGVLPIEIDIKAQKSFGKTWHALWELFRATLPVANRLPDGLPLDGYWGDPVIYWNLSGIYPGEIRRRFRARYGFFNDTDTLWISAYNDQGVSHIIEQRLDATWQWPDEHLWDPGPGGVAITRQGHHPSLVLTPLEQTSRWQQLLASGQRNFRRIPAPAGVLQLSGPVRRPDGHVAVAANLGGNWDIWLFDGNWQRVTDAESVELDPWWEGDQLLFASNATGRFQIHDSQMERLSDCPTAGMLPRNGHYVCLAHKGWEIRPLAGVIEAQPLPKPLPSSPGSQGEAAATLVSEPYRPLKSIWPNYLIPDIFIGSNDSQFGFSTKGRDISGNYRIDAGIRYAFDDEELSGRLGGTAGQWGLRLTRYPFSYTTADNQSVSELRNEVQLNWSPQARDEIELSVNWRDYEPLEGPGPKEEESWGSLALRKQFDRFHFWLNLDAFTEGSQSLFGGFSLWFGDKINTAWALYAGQTWGDPIVGHNTFRLGGDVEEGYFTRRPTRLFPLRGFESNLLDDQQAVTSHLEVFWPLANLQMGYQNLPLFLHRLKLGTFVDAGVAGSTYNQDTLLIGAGFELITTMELAWGNLSAFRIGVAWPVAQPDLLDEDGPVFLIQLGKPL